MSASRRRPTSCFQPGMAAMYACTGASPTAFAIVGFPPESRTGESAEAAPRLGAGERPPPVERRAPVFVAPRFEELAVDAFVGFVGFGDFVDFGDAFVAMVLPPVCDILEKGESAVDG